MGVPLEFAQDDRHSIPLGKAGEFFLHERGEVRVGIVRGGRGEGVELLRGRKCDPGGSLPEFEGGVDRHPVQPPPDALAANRSGLPGQDEERRLERVLGVGFGTEDTTTGGPDGVGVPADQEFEGSRVPLSGEPPGEIPIGNVVPGRAGGREQTEKESTGHARFRTG
jgi:hypothetical protein